MPSTTRVYDMVRALLDAAVTYWPMDAEPLPDRQYVAPGQIIWDGCDQLVATVERQANVEADVGIEQYSVQGPGLTNRFAVVAVALIRCVHDLADDGVAEAGPPTPAEMESDAVIQLTDSESLYQSILAGHRAGEITSCRGLAYEAWTSEGPQGGFAGGTLRVRVLLN